MVLVLLLFHIMVSPISLSFIVIGIIASAILSLLVVHALDYTSSLAVAL